MQRGCDLWVGGSAPWTLLTTYSIQFRGLYLRLKLKWEDIHQTFILPNPMEGCSESGGHPGNNLAKFGYILDMKVGKKKKRNRNPSLYLATY
jgi:hypothetical protein